MGLESIEVLFFTKLKAVLLQEFVDDYMAEFEQEYDRRLGGYNFKPYDLTAPKHIKADVVSYIRKSLLEGVQQLDPKGDFNLSAVSLDVFSRPDNRDTDSLKLFYFYLHGSTDKHVSISRESFDRMFSKRKRSANLRLGRFGKMFMMSYDKYRALYNSSDGSARGWPSPASIEHPISGGPPARGIFDDVQSTIEKGFDKYIKKAQDLVNKT